MEAREGMERATTSRSSPTRTPIHIKPIQITVYKSTVERPRPPHLRVRLSGLARRPPEGLGGRDRRQGGAEALRVEEPVQEVGFQYGADLEERLLEN